MNALATCSPIANKPPLPQDIEVPQWLADCWQSWQAPVADSLQDGSCLICRAFSFAYELHAGQRRKSGEPYIAHPVAVAGLLRDLGGDEAMIAAGFLHDVVEDTDVTIEQIQDLFGEETANLVEGVTKLSKFNFSSTTEHQAENFR
ncbi:MAG: HD domain-containing protein, partial [Synechocystis sp.]